MYFTKGCDVIISGLYLACFDPQRDLGMLVVHAGLSYSPQEEFSPDCDMFQYA